MIYNSNLEPQHIQDAKMRTNIIHLKANKYKKSNLNDLVESYTYLDKLEKTKSLKLLNDPEDLFDGTLGQFDCQPAKF